MHSNNLDTLSLALAKVRKDLSERKMKGTLKKLNEGQTKAGFIEPVLNALGWDTRDINEVTPEHSLPKGGPNGGGGAVDYALFLESDENPALLLETKKLGMYPLSEHHQSIRQAVDYGYLNGIRWCALSNGIEYHVYSSLDPGRLEQQLLTKIDITKSDSPESAAREMSILSRESLKNQVLDTLWETLHVDYLLKSEISDVLGEPKFRESLARKIRQKVESNRAFSGINTKSITASIGRAEIAISYPPIYDYLNLPTKRKESRKLSTDEKTRRDKTTSNEGRVGTKNRSDGRPRKSGELIRTPEMFRRKLLKFGMHLTIKNHSESESTVVDGSHVNFRGSIMKFNEWGKHITGWRSIDIYEHVLLSDGRLLGDLRK